MAVRLTAFHRRDVSLKHDTARGDCLLFPFHTPKNTAPKALMMRTHLVFEGQAALELDLQTQT